MIYGGWSSKTIKEETEMLEENILNFLLNGFINKIGKYQKK